MIGNITQRQVIWVINATVFVQEWWCTNEWCAWKWTKYQYLFCHKSIPVLVGGPDQFSCQILKFLAGSLATSGKKKRFTRLMQVLKRRFCYFTTYVEMYHTSTILLCGLFWPLCRKLPRYVPYKCTCGNFWHVRPRSDARRVTGWKFTDSPSDPADSQIHHLIR